MMFGLKEAGLRYPEMDIVSTFASCYYTSKALVTSSDALVPSSLLFLIYILFLL